MLLCVDSRQRRGHRGVPGARDHRDRACDRVLPARPWRQRDLASLRWLVRHRDRCSRLVRVGCGRGQRHVRPARSCPSAGRSGATVPDASPRASEVAGEWPGGVTDEQSQRHDRHDAAGGAPVSAGLRRSPRRPTRKPDIYERDFDEFWGPRDATASPGSSRSRSSTSGSRRTRSGTSAASSTSAYNCVDRHVEGGQGDQVAYHWEGEPDDDRRTITFADLQREVVRFANGLKELGVKKGTPVGDLHGHGAGAAVAMLACARLGAPHTVVFGGFSADSLSDRMNDMELRGPRSPRTRPGARATGAAEADRRRGDGRRAGRQACLVLPAHR